MKRKCTNCAFCERFKYFQTDKTEMMRCWHETDACDHAFVISMVRAEKYKCDNHRFQNERDKELFEEAKLEYESHKNEVEKLEKKYPQLKKLNGNSEIPKDLGEAAKAYADDINSNECLYTYTDFTDAFIAGAKWQKEQMMKEAVEGWVSSTKGDHFGCVTSVPTDLGKLYGADKCKIIIIKED